MTESGEAEAGEVTHDEADITVGNLRVNLGGETIGTERLARYIKQQRTSQAALVVALGEKRELTETLLRSESVANAELTRLTANRDDWQAKAERLAEQLASERARREHLKHTIDNCVERWREFANGEGRDAARDTYRACADRLESDSEPWPDASTPAPPSEAPASPVAEDDAGFPPFGVDPGDSAALEKLRTAIDDHLIWPSDAEQEVGDYEAAVRHSGELALRFKSMASPVAEGETCPNESDHQYLHLGHSCRACGVTKMIGSLLRSQATSTGEAKDSSPSPGATTAWPDSGAAKPREAGTTSAVAADSPGDGAGDSPVATATEGEQTSGEAEQELRAQGVDVDGFLVRAKARRADCEARGRQLYRLPRTAQERLIARTAYRRGLGEGERGMTDLAGPTPYEEPDCEPPPASDADGERRCPFGFVQTSLGEPCVCAGCRPASPPSAALGPVEMVIAAVQNIALCKEAGDCDWPVGAAFAMLANELARMQGEKR